MRTRPLSVNLLNSSIRWFVPRCLLEFDEHIARQAVDVHDLATAIEGASLVILGIGLAVYRVIDWSFNVLFNENDFHKALLHPPEPRCMCLCMMQMGGYWGIETVMEIPHVTESMDPRFNWSWLNQSHVSLSFTQTVSEDLRSQKDRQRPIGIEYLCSCNSATKLSVVTVFCSYCVLVTWIQRIFWRGAGAASAALSAWEIGTCAPSTGASTVPWTASWGKR